MRTLQGHHIIYIPLSRLPPGVNWPVAGLLLVDATDCPISSALSSSTAPAKSPPASGESITFQFGWFPGVPGGFLFGLTFSSLDRFESSEEIEDLIFCLVMAGAKIREDFIAVKWLVRVVDDFGVGLSSNAYHKRIKNTVSKQQTTGVVA